MRDWAIRHVDRAHQIVDNAERPALRVIGIMVHVGEAPTWTLTPVNRPEPRRCATVSAMTVEITLTNRGASHKQFRTVVRTESMDVDFPLPVKSWLVTHVLFRNL
jgi:hypothetical protein